MGGVCKTRIGCLELTVLLGLTGLLVTGCGTSTTVMLNSEPPIPVEIGMREQLLPVRVSGVITAVPVDQEIGHAHQGILNLTTEDYRAGSKLSEAHALILTSLEEELMAAGYRIIESHGSLFGVETAADDGDVLLIGGEVVECSFDSYNSIGNRKSTAMAVVAWSVFDPVADAVIHKVEAEGRAQGPEKSVSSLAFAVRASFREFIADPRFLTLLTGRSGHRGDAPGTAGGGS